MNSSDEKRLGMRASEAEARVANIISDVFSYQNLSQVVRELTGGMRIYGENGKLLNHVAKLEQGISGLRREIDAITGLLKSGSLTPQLQSSLEGLKLQAQLAIECGQKLMKSAQKED